MTGRSVVRTVTRPAPFLLSLVLLAGVWEVAGRTADLITLPPLSDVLRQFGVMLASGELVDPLADSLRSLGIGLAISIVAGTAIGVAMGLSPAVDAALDIYVKAGLAAPIIAFVPLFLLVFGIGSTTRIATVVAFSIWVVIVNTATGIRRSDPALLEMARSFGASRSAQLREIRLVEASPYLLEGLRLGVARGVKGLINGEVLIAIVGLGGLVKRYGTVFSMDKLYAVILFIVLLALVSVALVGLVGRLLFRHRPQGT
ncbi:ABC transporter permease [Micromonospora fluostatini]|uniref:ABC transporter permease n=1 Tax=Micromonospora sp. JCM 30529 TaxID=3421643 RepID=UPI003D1784BE